MAINPAKHQKKMPRMSRALFEFGGLGRNRPEPRIFKYPSTDCFKFDFKGLEQKVIYKFSVYILLKTSPSSLIFCKLYFCAYSCRILRKQRSLTPNDWISDNFDIVAWVW